MPNKENYIFNELPELHLVVAFPPPGMILVLDWKLYAVEVSLIKEKATLHRRFILNFSEN